MSKILEQILTELYDGNTVSPEYTDEYIQKLLRAKEYNPLNSVPVDEVDDGEVNPENFHQALVDFIMHGEDELTIEYENGSIIRLEAEIVKNLVAKASVQELEAAAESPEYMHDLLVRVCDGIEELEDELDDEGEE